MLEGTEGQSVKFKIPKCCGGVRGGGCVTDGQWFQATNQPPPGEVPGGVHSALIYTHAQSIQSTCVLISLAELSMKIEHFFCRTCVNLELWRDKLRKQVGERDIKIAKLGRREEYCIKTRRLYCIDWRGCQTKEYPKDVLGPNVARPQSLMI